MSIVVITNYVITTIGIQNVTALFKFAEYGNSFIPHQQIQ